MTATPPTPRLAGHALVEALVAQGVHTCFGVPGESYLAVLDGFHEHREHIRFIACRQEGGAAFMAEAQGKLTGRPGVCFVTRGPGATNASIGVHTAFQDSTPMVLFVGQVASDQRDREAFQEIDYRQMFSPGTLGLAKWVAEVQSADRLPEYVARAFHTAMQGRPGPVVLALPEDMLLQLTTAPVLPRVEPVRAWPAPGGLRELRALLMEAERPIVIAGGSGWDAEAANALQRFAENWHLPVACGWRFQDTFDNRHPLYAGDVGIAFEMIAVLRFGEPSLLGLAFTFPPARRLGAIRLMAEVPSIREKHTFAMQALPRVGRRRHGARQENPTTVASQSEVQDPRPATSEEDPSRRKKKSIEWFEENPPPDTRFSN